MSARSFDKGHEIYYDDNNNVWRYQDNNQEATEQRPCIRCNKSSSTEGDDWCIRRLPGVTNACCGHGNKGYISFENGVTIRFKEAIIERGLL